LGLESNSSQKFLLSFTAAAAGAGILGSGFSLEGPGSTLSALAVLAAIVTVHECGHFLAARLQGIHVSKFSIGFGPALYTYQGEKVEYSLRLFPLGGYVAFPDDEPASQSGFEPDDPDLLKNRSIGERAAVISAGVIANIIFAYLALLVQVSTVGKAETAFLPGVRIPEVVSGSAAARAGFRDGDLLLKVDGLDVPAAPEQVAGVVGRIRDSPGKQMEFIVQRDGELVQVLCVPDVANGKGRIGVQLSSNAFINHIKADNPGEVFSIATAEFNRLSGTVFKGLVQIVTNFSKMVGQLSGPVAIVAAGSEIARTDAAGLFQFCAIVNINLAAVNILPLPALDGGYLVLLAVEAARGGKKLPPGVEQGVMASGLLVLLVAGIGLVIRDTVNLVVH